MTTAIALTSFPMDRGQKFDHHVHDRHQLAWASSGILTVEVANRAWVLPSTQALWIPAGVEHASLAVRSAVLEGIYIDPAGSAHGWSTPTVVAISPLARHLIRHLATDLDDTRRARAETVLLDVLEPIDKTTLELPIPVDARARTVADLLLADPSDQRSLDELGRQVGASARTLLRLFLAETALPFNQWRTHARLHAAMPYLAEGKPVAAVARRVGYATASSFIAAFHRVTGHTPATYFALPADGSDDGDGAAYLRTPIVSLLPRPMMPDTEFQAKPTDHICR